MMSLITTTTTTNTSISSSSNNNNNNNNKSSSSSSSSSQACAACKYQRRKCAAECALAPYFPHSRQRQFLNAHRLFGVSNITKIIKSLHDQRARDDAMRSIIFQSDARASDPVGGCLRIVRDLQTQLHLATSHLHSLSLQLSLLRSDHDDVASWVLPDPPHDDVVLKEESFSIQQDDGNDTGEGLRDEANFFNLTNCSS